MWTLGLEELTSLAQEEDSPQAIIPSGLLCADPHCEVACIYV